MIVQYIRDTHKSSNVCQLCKTIWKYTSVDKKIMDWKN